MQRNRKPNVILKGQTRKMVYDVYNFLKPFSKYDKDTVRQTSEATKTSISTVRRIIQDAKNKTKSDLLTVFRTPGKKRAGKKKITNIDNFDQSILKRSIHNYHVTNKDIPSVEKLRQKLNKDINFKGSERSLRRILKGLGFRWKKTEGKRKLLIEKTNIRLQRIEYLQKIRAYRLLKRPIIYTDETFIDSTPGTGKSSTEGSSQGVKKPNSKAQRIVIVHAGSEAGFVPNALLLFKTNTKTGDQHENMDYQSYERWVRKQLLPNLPPNSVVIFDNASYHNKQSDSTPTAYSHRSIMQNWLREKGIHYDEDMYKPQLYNLIKYHKEQQKQYNVDEILAEHGHTVIRLPSYHPDLNPIETAWKAIKEHAGNNDADKTMELVKEKINAIDTNEWENLCRKVKDIEYDYIKSDRVIDSLTDQFIISADDDDSDSDDDTDDDNHNDDEDGENNDHSKKPKISCICDDDDDDDDDDEDEDYDLPLIKAEAVYD